MKPLSTIKKNPARGWTAYGDRGQIIATISPKDARKGYLICWVNGPAHGKISYGTNWEDVNEKVSEYSRMSAVDAGWMYTLKLTMGFNESIANKVKGKINAHIKFDMTHLTSAIY